MIQCLVIMIQYNVGIRVILVPLDEILRYRLSPTWREPPMAKILPLTNPGIHNISIILSCYNLHSCKFSLYKYTKTLSINNEN